MRYFIEDREIELGNLFIRQRFFKSFCCEENSGYRVGFKVCLIVKEDNPMKLRKTSSSSERREKLKSRKSLSKFTS